MNTIKIGEHVVCHNSQPFIVAEMSGNHNQSLERALKIVDAAAKAGCHALKIQTYTADTMTIDSENSEFLINDSDSLWNKYSLYDLYKKAYTPWDWHELIFKRCKELGVVGFSTPFDETAVDFLETFDIPIYKVASFEITDLPLIKKIASTGKPLIISTGMATISEIDDAVQTAKNNGCKELILLKCTSSYPADHSEANLLTIPHLQQLFDIKIGLSDHTAGIGTALASIPLGACVIEKHFTLDRSDGGVDSEFSMEPAEMKMLVEESKRAYLSLGKIQYGKTIKESKSLRFRRSLFAVKNIQKDEIITKDNVRRIRPGNGLPPKHYEAILDKKASVNIKRGTPLQWNMIY